MPQNRAAPGKFIVENGAHVFARKRGRKACRNRKAQAGTSATCRRGWIQQAAASWQTKRDIGTPGSHGNNHVFQRVQPQRVFPANFVTGRRLHGAIPTYTVDQLHIGHVEVDGVRPETVVNQLPDLHFTVRQDFSRRINVIQRNRGLHQAVGPWNLNAAGRVVAARCIKQLLFGLWQHIKGVEIRGFHHGLRADTHRRCEYRDRARTGAAAAIRDGDGRHRGIPVTLIGDRDAGYLASHGGKTCRGRCTLAAAARNRDDWCCVTGTPA